MKIKYLIISLVLCLLLGGAGIGIYCAWPAITGTINNSKYYTAEDLQQSYDKGYNDGINNETELTSQVNYYKELTDTYYNSILGYQNQVSEIQKQNSTNREQIKILEDVKSSLQNQVQILEKNNEKNINTITILNNQINTLNSQIVELTNQIQINSGTVNVLNSKINQLEKSVLYYENYIKSLENNDQVIATFEYDGSIYNIQVLNKNSIASVVDPISTEYVIFNYWTVDGQTVNLNEYPITTSTKFVASVTYKYIVKFSVDNNIFETQLVIKNNTPTLPNIPSKENFVFEGWTKDGVNVIDINNLQITENLTLFAKFSLISYDITFNVDNTQYGNAQKITINTSPNVPDSPIKDGYEFIGWSLDGTNIIDVSTYIVTGPVNFIAVFEESEGLYDADTKERVMTWTELIDGQYIVNNEGVLTGGTNKKDINGILKISNTITKLGSSAFAGCSGLLEVNLPNSITYIAGSAFSSCSNLTKINIPNSVTLIGSNAFYNCEKLSSINLPDSITSIDKKCFSGCTSLKNINIPINITNLQENVFAYCDGIESVYIPKNIKVINSKAFQNCKNLSSIIIDDENEKYEAKGVNAVIEKKTNKFILGCKTSIIPSGITTIGDSAFSSCYGLTTITIPSTVTVIGNYAFYCCTNLSTIQIPNSVISIGNYAFYQCETVTGNLSFGYGLTTIGDYAFAYLPKISTLSLPNSVTSIGSCAFQSCYGLTNVTIPNSVITLGASAFSACRNLKSVILSSSLTTLSAATFRDCCALQSIKIPASITSIGNYAFAGSRDQHMQLTKIEFENGSNLTSIGAHSFLYCSGLISLEIPAKVESIGVLAFENCSGLLEVVVRPTVPPSATGSFIFYGYNKSLKIKVPNASLSDYRNATNWSMGKSLMVGY